MTIKNIIWISLIIIVLSPAGFYLFLAFGIIGIIGPGIILAIAAFVGRKDPPFEGKQEGYTPEEINHYLEI